MMTRGIRLCAVLVCLIILGSGICLSQEATGEIRGVVKDETGGVLPGAKVSLFDGLTQVADQTSGINGDFRFIGLRGGRYGLQCEAEGFEAYVYKHVEVKGGRATQISILLKPAGTPQTMTILLCCFGVDPRRTWLGRDVSYGELRNLPTSRDPWAILAMTPGIVLDRVNVGGSEAGRQPELTCRGDVGGENSMWVLDGLTITDMAALGMSPTYYDFDSIDEIQITTGGNDPSLATGGMSINMITKRGGDTPRGSTRFYTTSEGLQSDNTKDLASPSNPNGATTLDGFKWNPSFVPTKLVKLREYGVEFGGPIAKDKLWYWGAVAVQDIQRAAVNKGPQNTQIENYSFKTNGQWKDSDSLTFFYMRGDKIERGRDASPTRPPETAWNLGSPTDIYKLDLSHMLNPDLYLSGTLGIVRSKYHLAAQGGLNAQVQRDANLVYHGSYIDSVAERPQWQATLNSHYYSNALGGNHDFKFGFSFRRVDTESVSRWPGEGVVADAYTGTAWLTRASHNLARNNYLSFYAGDSFARDRLVLNLGFRFDRQAGGILAASTPANQMFPDVLPAVNVAARDAPFTWNDFSPRLGATYDVTGDGKTLLRTSFADYADQLGSEIVSNLSPIASGITELDYYWNDVNADGYVQPSEVDFYPPYDWEEPLPSTTALDPELTAPRRTELIIGGERQIADNFLAGANFVWQRARNLLWKVGTDYQRPDRPYTHDDYVLAGTITGTLPDGTPYNMPFYRLSDERRSLDGAGVDSLLTNRSGYSETYRGVEIYAMKRPCEDKLLLNAWASWQTSRRHFAGTTGISNPTNEIDGEDTAFQSASEGAEAYWISTPRWMFNLNAVYSLPRGFSVAGVLSGREGFPIVYFRSKYYVDPGLAALAVRAQPIGSSKLPNPIELDLRLSKAIGLGDKGVVNLDLDIFNVLNRNTPLHVTESLSSSRLNYVADIMNPRLFRLGVRYSF
ncbi:MAG: carboxypeptidase regulatory-like domain-containing protein [Acidobacteriota bacterium]